MKNNKLENACDMLSQIFNDIQSLKDTKNISEAKGHIRQALSKIEKELQSKPKKKNNLSEQWWGHIIANAPFTQLSPTASIKALDQLNAMIDVEQNKIDELEKKSQQMTDNNAQDLLID